jgi:hypothetical protein
MKVIFGTSVVDSGVIAGAVKRAERKGKPS